MPRPRRRYEDDVDANFAPKRNRRQTDDGGETIQRHDSEDEVDTPRRQGMSTDSDDSDPGIDPELGVD